MATLPINNLIRGIPKSIFESAINVIGSSNSWNQGDILAFDTSAKVLKAVSADSDSPNVLGVARQTIVSGKVRSPYTGTAVDASQAIEDIAGPAYSVVAKLILKTGDAFAPGALVYLYTAGDAQHVTSTQPGTNPAIGIYQGANISSAASGATGEILVGNNYGVSSLQF